MSRWRRDRFPAPPPLSGEVMLFCPAVMRYMTAGTTGIASLDSALSACLLPGDHDGNHLAYVPGRGYRAFPR